MAPPEKIVHLYRRLLRAATYVPDSFARTYVHDYLVNRFKANCTLDNLAKPNAKELTTNRLKKARHWATILENAGQGSVEDLRKVLLQAHGRRGARKRILIRQLLQPDENSLPKDDAALEELMNSPLQESKFEIEQGTRLDALSRSQQEHHPKNQTKLRRLEPNIPEENMWGRPTPRKLAASLRKRWWASHLDKLLPPVPHSEWKRLHDLATGAILVEPFHPRRPKGTVTSSQSAEEESATGVELLNALRSSARLARLQAKELEPARSVRRMYADILNMTPTILWEKATTKIYDKKTRKAHDETKEQWVVYWGSQKSKAQNGVVPKPAVQEMELFEGAESLTDTKPPKQRMLKRLRRNAILEAQQKGEFLHN
ncbi:hypothetical protein BDZ45DRAFT_647009 [Acephala macrosclerotiorum]|nr:hypothetical protein BDZ45DRAFT_647009 [Acephala macrosclerotiorum]